MDVRNDFLTQLFSVETCPADERSYPFPQSELSSCEEKETLQETTVLSDRHVLWPLPTLGARSL